jgi:16S rRNA (cytosine1402-N4)-methyltransferase
MDGAHKTVLLEEAVSAVMRAPDGVYFDGTFGRGGHCRHLLSRLSLSGRVIAVDKDPEAERAASILAAEDSRFEFRAGSFTRLLDAEVPDASLDGVLLDLGVSSPQLDQRDRGFSFQHDGPLDMRMDTRSGLTAGQWVQTARQEEMAEIFKRYGEERFARRIAAAIAARRAEKPFTRTADLAKVIAEAHPRWEQHKHPATRVFQAIRIHINGELEELQQLLDGVIEKLAPGGRLVVISFHSLEDRCVKQFMRRGARGVDVPRDIPLRGGKLGQTLRLLGKAVRPSDAEVQANPRARSAIMRVAERLS